MAYNEPPDLTDGDELAPNWLNRYFRDNVIALKPGTTAGDMAYYSTPYTMGRIPIGANNYALRSKYIPPSTIAFDWYRPFYDSLGLPYFYPTVKSNVHTGELGRIIVFNGMPYGWGAYDYCVYSCTNNLYAKTIYNVTGSSHQIQFDLWSSYPDNSNFPNYTPVFWAQAGGSLKCYFTGRYMVDLEGSIQSQLITRVYIKNGATYYNFYPPEAAVSGRMYRMFNMSRIIPVSINDLLEVYIVFDGSYTQNIDYQGISINLTRIHEAL